MEEAALGPNVEPRDRVRSVLYQMTYFDNTSAYQWFLELARALLDFQGDRLSLADATWLCDRADKLMARHDWEAFVLRRSNLEKVIVARNFDDPLTGFDTRTYVPCLNADDLVFHLDQPDVRQRLANVTQVEVGDWPTMKVALSCSCSAVPAKRGPGMRCRASVHVQACTAGRARAECGREAHAGRGCPR